MLKLVYFHLPVGNFMAAIDWWMWSYGKRSSDPERRQRRGYGVRHKNNKWNERVAVSQALSFYMTFARVSGIANTYFYVLQFAEIHKTASTNFTGSLRLKHCNLLSIFTKCFMAIAWTQRFFYGVTFLTIEIASSLNEKECLMMSSQNVLKYVFVQTVLIKTKTCFPYTYLLGFWSD